MKETIIILHGWGLDGKKFSSLADEFFKLGYRVFSPDMPGFGGEKSPQRPFALTDYADFLLNFYKKNKLSKAIIVGHSFGGRVALKFDELYPKYVTSLILTGTPGFTPVAKKKLILAITVAKIFKLIFKIPPLSFFEGPVRIWYYYVVGAKEYYRAEGVMRETFKNIVREELVPSMRAVRCPTLLIWGGNDIIVPVSIANKMQGEIRNSKLLVVENVDHGLPFREPQRFAADVRNFLKSI